MAIYRFPLAIFYSINASVGVIGNVIMVLCFFKNQNLRNPCHVLITLLCSSDILNLCGECIFAVGVFGNWQTTQHNCYCMQIVPLIGASAGSTLILVIGIDRLIAVYFPIWYRNVILVKGRYVLALLTFPFAYTVFILMSGYKNSLAKDSELFFCSLPAGIKGWTFKMFNYASVFIYISVLSVYTAVFVSLKTHKTSTQFKKVFQSLAVTVTLVLFGWVTATILNIANIFFVTDLDISEMNIMYSGVPLHFSLSCNVFVFYFINPDYRKTIRKVLRIVENSEKTSKKTSGGQKVGPS